jgi:hypothetical protein
MKFCLHSHLYCTYSSPTSRVSREFSLYGDSEPKASSYPTSRVQLLYKRHIPTSSSRSFHSRFSRPLASFLALHHNSLNLTSGTFYEELTAASSKYLHVDRPPSVIRLTVKSSSGTGYLTRNFVVWLLFFTSRWSLITTLQAQRWNGEPILRAILGFLEGENLASGLFRPLCLASDTK